ncbi:putative DnaJ domain, Chaperone J-domain superfamily [Plasmopara halstedii]
MYMSTQQRRVTQQDMAVERMRKAQESGYYSVLEIDVDASPSVIVKAYRSMALKYHPDKNPNARPDQFIAINEAYEVLSDPKKRRLYDTYGPSLQPHLGETVAQLVPLLLSFVTGFLGSSVRVYSESLSTRMICTSQVCLMGLVGMYYCHQPSVQEDVEPPITPERKSVSVSDYVTITFMGLLVGNFSGWAAASIVQFCKAIA